jgi:hypothetical protein
MGDTVLEKVDEIADLAIEDNHVTFSARRNSAVVGSNCRLSLGPEGLGPEQDAFDFLKTIAVSQRPLSAGSNDLLLPEVPGRLCDMSSKNIAFNCGVRAEKLDTPLIQNILGREKTRLGIEGESYTCGTVQEIALGDFSGRGRQDAAVIVATPRAQGEELDLMAFGIEQGEVICYGVVPLGTGGLDTWGEKLRIESGMIALDLTVGEKNEAPPPNAEVSWKFKACRGKLIKCL